MENNQDIFEIENATPNTVLIRLSESVVGGNQALTFTNKLEEFHSQGTKQVIIDLENVSVMNSSGLGMLVSGLSTLRKHGIKLVLVNIPEKVLKLLKMTHLDEVFTVMNTKEEALSSFS